MNTEIWKPVAGFETIYSVSSLGRVRRDAGGMRGARPGRVLNPRAGGTYGHICVKLHHENREHPRLVHRLVAEAFLPAGRPDQKEVAHNNGNAADNRVENLRWATSAENNADRLLHGTSNRGVRNGGNKLTEDDVLAIVELKSRGLLQREIAQAYSITRQTVSDIFLGRRWAWLTKTQEVAA